MQADEKMLPEVAAELLFFDTFSHSNTEDSNLDLVQFPKPVYIEEIRIIPLGARVQADFPGGHPRLGATNPSAFQLEFFVNDLSRRNASTFVQLGKMEYTHNLDIQFVPTKVPTDGLLLRGLYTTITLAVYGSITKLNETQSTTPPQQAHKADPSQPHHHSSHHQPVVVPLEWQSSDHQPPIDVRQQHHAYTAHTTATNSPHELQTPTTGPPETPLTAEPPRWPSTDAPLPPPEDSATKDFEEQPRYTPPPSAKKRKRPRTPPIPCDPSRGQESRSPEREDRRERRTSQDRSVDRERHIERRHRSEHRGRDEHRRRSNSTTEREKLSSRKRSCSPESRDDFSDDLEEISSEDEPFDPNSASARDSLSPAKNTDILDCVVTFKEQLMEEISAACFLREGRHFPPSLDVARVVEIVKDSQDMKRTSEKFVLAMEDLAGLFVTNSKFESIPVELQSTIMDWCRDGLDFDLALSQAQPAFKVRHLKAAMRLACSVMSSCSEQVMASMLNRDIAGGVFLRLYLAPHMSLPLKLQLVRCLDLLSYFECGLSYLMYHRVSLSFDTTTSDLFTCYQALVKILLEKPSSRLSVALSALLSKLHLCDLCATLKNVAVDLMNSEAGNEPSLDEAITILKQISEMHQEAATTMGQFVRSLPARGKFEHPIPAEDPYRSLHTMYRYNDLLVACGVLSSRSRSFLQCFGSLINQIMSTLSGCLFLLENPSIVPLLERLVPRCSSQLRALSLICTVFEETSDEALDEFQGDVDRNEVLVGALHRMAAMTLEKDTYVVNGLVNALAFESNVECLLLFVRKGDIPLKTVSCAGYSILLLKTLVQHCTSVPFFEKYTQKLLELPETTSRLEVLSPWLEPIAKLGTPIDNGSIVSLVAAVKTYIVENALLCPQMISCLRILLGICVPKHFTCDEKLTLKYRYNLAELYSHDGLSVLCQIMEKLSEHYSAPLAMKLELSSKVKVVKVLQVLTPTVELVSQMLKQVISCRGSDFNDLTPIPILLSSYQLSWMIGEERLSCLLIATLLAYTQPMTDGTESEQTLNKSLWTLMLKKVLQNLKSGPRAFGLTLQVICELLPMPLPMKVERPIESEEDIKTLVTNRKLWSVHLDLCRSELLELYQTLSTSTDINVVRMLELLTRQICDLSAPSCQLILEIISEAITTIPSSLDDEQQIQGPIGLLSHICSSHLPTAAGALLLYSNPETEKNPIASAVTLLGESILEAPTICSVQLIRNALVCANNYTNKDTMSMLVKALLEHLSSDRSTPSTILEVVRCISDLKDTGVNHIQDVIGENIKMIYQGLKQMSAKFATHCQDSLSGLLSFIELIMELDSKCKKELVNMTEDDETPHPLAQLKDKLKEESCEGLETSYNELQALLDQFRCEPNSEMDTAENSEQHETPIQENVVAPKTLSEIFEADRVIFVVSTVSVGELNASELLKVTSDFDEYHDVCSGQKDSFLIETDLVSISEMCTMSELSLRAELEKMLSKTIKQEPLQLLPKHHRSHSVSEEAKKPFVAPMRASVTPMARGPSRANDPFRSRPPNTSRPPSMHVDDFVAMETTGPSSGPTGPPSHHRSSSSMHRGMERPMRPHLENRGPPRGQHPHARAPWGSQRYF